MLLLVSLQRTGEHGSFTVPERRDASVYSAYSLNDNEFQPGRVNAVVDCVLYTVIRPSLFYAILE